MNLNMSIVQSNITYTLQISQNHEIVASQHIELIQSFQQEKLINQLVVILFI